MKHVLPEDSIERKGIPLTTGLLDYFSAALAEVAKVSVIGNEKHNAGQPLHWSREKSQDHADCVSRHLLERGGFDEVKLPGGRVERIRHSAEGAWRYLALLQEELEAAGAPPSRASRFPAPKPCREAMLDALDRRIKTAEEKLYQDTTAHMWAKALVKPKRDWLDRLINWLVSR